MADLTAQEKRLVDHLLAEIRRVVREEIKAVASPKQPAK